jgi:glyoxylase I family protein
MVASSTLAALAVSGFTAAGTAEAAVQSPRQRVSGIGGLFFRSPDPKKLTEWYQRALGIEPTPSDYEHSPWQQAAGPTAFSPFPLDTDYFGAKQQTWMVNFRVPNLDAMVAQLRADGISVDVDSKTYPNGRFARLHDPDGNPIELWEPAERAALR